MLRQNCNHSSSATQNTINFCEKSQSIIAGTIIMYIYNTTENRNINLLSNPYALLPRGYSDITASHLYNSNEWYHFLALNHTRLRFGYGGLK